MLSDCGTMELETERLTLRRFKYSDDDDMLTFWISDPKIQSMYSEPVYTTKNEVKELLDMYIQSYEKKIITDGLLLIKKAQFVSDK